MKIGIFGIDSLSEGKENIIDQRLDTVKGMARSSKRVYAQIELVSDFNKLKECKGIISVKDKQSDIIITDLEFIEKRLSLAQDQKEKELLNRLKEQLEKENFISGLQLSEEDNRIISGYGLLSIRPIFLAEPDDSPDKDRLLYSAYTYFGYISFFTANEKEARAWPIKNKTTAWEASGLIHTAIQKGFIRAEVIGFDDLTKDGGINQAKSSNHLHLEGKDYVVQDGDLIKFRFNK